MKKDFDSLSDEQLIDRLRNGEDAVAEYLCNKYKNLVRSKVKNMFIFGGDVNDLIQEGMIGLFKAVRDYDAGRDASFFTFADLCVTRQIYTAVQASNRQKNIPLNSYISLYSENKDSADEDTGYNLLNSLIDSGNDPENLLLDKERVKHLMERIDEELSAFERQVLDLYLTGMNYVEIAKVLGREEKATDNALQRLKNKIKKIVKQS